ncbi:hypothetical protein [Candidatus Methylacidithermus pantelleriae]|uniref:GYF domain-containing protein n=1 Tax=Candidatus Methylacidithermus pantelleriae TaxID=2744239 RepID=A0A8J2BJM3_9BACT|nr:hypothetical protein [Candidatus Methylacidithermus pantelleriae]CAF0697766.1 membrane hypothetical protein [Candidatus Methylacidithermus pantelleriae]
MPESYYYHAPDNRIYGPADRATLERWLKERRIEPTSKVSQEGKEGFRTVEEVLREVPVPEVPPEEGVLAQEQVPVKGKVPQETVSKDVLPRVSCGRFIEVIQEAFVFLERSLPTYLAMGVFLQLPNLFFTVWTQWVVLASKGQAPKIPGGIFTASLLFILVGLLAEIFSAPLIHYTWQWAVGEGVPSWARAWEVSRQRVGKLVGTFFLRVGILLLGMLVAMLPVALVGAAGHFSRLVRTLVVLLFLLILFGLIGFAIRLVLVPAVVLLEGLGGVRALERSIELVRGIRPGRISEKGEVQYVILVGLCVLLGATISLAVGFLLALVSGEDFVQFWMRVRTSRDWTSFALSDLVGFSGNAVALPLYTVLVVLWYLHRRKSLEDSSDGSVNPTGQTWLS